MKKQHKDSTKQRTAIFEKLNKIDTPLAKVS